VYQTCFHYEDYQDARSAKHKKILQETLAALKECGAGNYVITCSSALSNTECWCSTDTPRHFEHDCTIAHQLLSVMWVLGCQRLQGTL
jgi:L-rhamnose mutarotase